MQGTEIPLSPLLHGNSGKSQFIAELFFLHAAEIFIKASHDNDHAGQQHRTGSDHHGAEDFFRHDFSSQR